MCAEEQCPNLFQCLWIDCQGKAGINQKCGKAQNWKANIIIHVYTYVL